jgi:hypothetical protein
MGTKGLAIFSPGISTLFPLISLGMLEASTTSPRFLSWIRNTSMIPTCGYSQFSLLLLLFY